MFNTSIFLTPQMATFIALLLFSNSPTLSIYMFSTSLLFPFLLFFSLLSSSLLPPSLLFFFCLVSSLSSLLFPSSLLSLFFSSFSSPLFSFRLSFYSYFLCLFSSTQIFENYLWLSQRFPAEFTDIERATLESKKCAELVEKALKLFADNNTHSSYKRKIRKEDREGGGTRTRSPHTAIPLRIPTIIENLVTGRSR